MRTRQKVSRAGVELIKSFEGLRSTAARLPDGRWTLGYGHTFSAREGARVTQEDADALLRFDLLPIVDAINNAVLVPLNQNQFDALVSFCFNIGVDNFIQSSVLKCINEGRVTEAALAMDSWRSAEFNGQTYVLAPLIRRRAAEKNLFLTPDEAAGNAPSLLVRPLPDTAQATQTPSELSAPDRGGVLSAYPMSAPGFSPYSPPSPQPAQPAERQVIDLNAFTPRVADIVPPPYAAPRETVVEQLPDGLVTPSAMREAPAAPVVTPTPAPQAAYDELQMSPSVQAALARAQEELRLQEEQRRREEALRLEAQRLEAQQQEAQRLAEAAAAARVAEEMRLQAQRMEAVRLEQARELERLEAEQRERERAEQVRIEQESFERARLEREAAEREAAERETNQRAERERAEAVVREPAVATPEIGAEEAEKQRKAEAAAALMRLYSPYGAGGLGRPLSVPATPAAPVTAPVVAPATEPRPAPQEFSNHSVMTPQVAASAPLPAREEPQPQEAPPPAAPVDEDDGSVVDFTPVGSARTMAPPTVVALNPYGRSATPDPVSVPQPQPEPAVVEVPRPQAIDLSATPPAEVFTLKPEPAPEPVHWRDQLQRPLPTGYQNPVSDVEAPTSHFESLYQDDSEEWTMDGGRIAVASDDHHDHEHHRSVWQMIMDTLWWLLISFLGLGCLGVAAAAYTKSHDPAVIRNGFFNDYTSLSLIMAAVGILFVSISVWLIMKRLGGLKD